MFAPRLVYRTLPVMMFCTLLILGCRPSPANAADASIACGPYLTQAGKTGVTVRWTSSDRADGAVVVVSEGAKPLRVAAKIHEMSYPLRLADRYRPVERLVPEKLAGVYLYEAKIEGLKPGTWYDYTVAFGGHEVFGRFRTFPEWLEPFTFVAYGDSHAADVVAGHLGTHRPAFQLNLGDLVDQEHYPQYEKFFSPMVNALARNVPMAVTRGNHDESGRTLARLFGLNPAKLYYSFTYGDVHVVCLDSGLWRWPNPEKTTPAMLEWAEKDLAASKAKWKVVFYHEPTYDMSYRRSSWGQDHAMAMFARAGVDLVLSGHAHNYQRFAPMYLTGRNEKHPVTVVVSAGASEKYFTPPRRAEPHLAVLGTPAHYLVFRVEGDTLTGRAIDLRGRMLDKFTLSKEGGSLAPEYVAKAVPAETFGKLMQSLRITSSVDIPGGKFKVGDTFEVPVRIAAGPKEVTYSLRPAPDSADAMELVEPVSGKVAANSEVTVTVKLRAASPIHHLGSRDHIRPELHLECHYRAGEEKGIISTTRLRARVPQPAK